MWIIDFFNKVKDLWENGLRDVIIYGAIFITLLLSGLIRKLYHAIKNAILGLFSVEGAISFILAAAAVLTFLTKVGIIKW